VDRRRLDSSSCEATQRPARRRVRELGGGGVTHREMLDGDGERLDRRCTPGKRRLRPGREVSRQRTRWRGGVARGRELGSSGMTRRRRARRRWGLQRDCDRVVRFGNGRRRSLGQATGTAARTPATARRRRLATVVHTRF
jgi:hypothetical protein